MSTSLAVMQCSAPGGTNDGKSNSWPQPVPSSGDRTLAVVCRSATVFDGWSSVKVRLGFNLLYLLFTLLEDNGIESLLPCIPHISILLAK